MSDQWVAYGRGKDKGDWMIMLVLNREHHEVFRGSKKEVKNQFELYKYGLISGSAIQEINEKGKVMRSYLAV